MSTPYPAGSGPARVYDTARMHQLIDKFVNWDFEVALNLHPVVREDLLEQPSRADKGKGKAKAKARRGPGQRSEDDGRSEDNRRSGVSADASGHEDEEDLAEFIEALEFFATIKETEKYNIEPFLQVSFERFCEDHSTATFDSAVDLLPALCRSGKNRNYTANHALTKHAIISAVEIARWKDGHETWREAVAVRKMPRIFTTDDLYPIQYVGVQGYFDFHSVVVKRFREADLEWHLDGAAPDSAFWEGAELNDAAWRGRYLTKSKYKGQQFVEDDLREVDEKLRFVVPELYRRRYGLPVGQPVEHSIDDTDHSTGDEIKAGNESQAEDESEVEDTAQVEDDESQAEDELLRTRQSLALAQSSRGGASSSSDSVSPPRLLFRNRSTSSPGPDIAAGRHIAP